MDHNKCVEALALYGAGSLSSRMVPAFLHDRQMTVKINNTYSNCRRICGGSPQGSLLGNFLFCLTTDCFARLGDAEEESEDGVDVPEGRAVDTGGGCTRDSPVLVDSGGGTDDEDETVIRRPRRRMPWDTSDEEEECAVPTQYQLNSFFNLPTNWVDKKLFDCVYIDDYNTVEKILVKNSPLHISQNKQKILVHAPKTERRFARLSGKADEIGMIINKKKTQLLCVSGRNDSVVNAYINNEGSKTISSDKLKILGFTFGRQPNPEAHVSSVELSFRKKVWTLRNLKRAWLDSSDIVEMYCTVLRPAIEYCAATYHSMLTQEMSDRLERLQTVALKTVFGWNYTYDEVLALAGVEKLSDRRKKLFDSFAQKVAKNPRFAHWLPRQVNTGHNTRNDKMYQEEFSRTERYKNSPVFQIRRRLNQMSTDAS